jgi:hypothetical protein
MSEYFAHSPIVDWRSCSIMTRASQLAGGASTDEEIAARCFNRVRDKGAPQLTIVNVLSRSATENEVYHALPDLEEKSWTTSTAVPPGTAEIRYAQFGAEAD